jgi:His/Glu/Gln/Arg/opine family amino acid ABC transporter permease subunit
MDFEFSLFLKSLPALARGALLTAELTLVSILIGTAIGIMAGVGRLSSHRLLSWSVAAYVTLMRGVPLLVTLLFLYYGLPSAGIKLDAFTVGVVALSITSGPTSPRSFAPGSSRSIPGRCAPPARWACLMPRRCGALSFRKRCAAFCRQ